MRLVLVVFIVVLLPSTRVYGQTAGPVPIARGHVWAVVEERDLVAEGTAWDPATRSFLAGSLNRNKVVAIAEDGTVSDRVAGGLGSVVGIHVDTLRGILWVNSTPRYDDPQDTTTAALFGFEAATGRFIRRVDVPAGPSFLNDLTTDPDGTVYVTDSRAGIVRVLRPGAASFDVLNGIGPLRSPNGITIDGERRLLFVADFDHIRVHSLQDGRTWRLSAPDSLSMAGIDGLAWSAGELIAHHPLRSWRIARYALDAAAEQVTGVQFIERDTPDARTSTTGEVVGEWYYYIGNGQLDRMNEGTLDAATMEPIRLYRAHLGPQPRAVVGVALSAVDSVVLFDAHTLERMTSLPVGRNPHELAPSRNGRTLYVADAGGATITVLDAAGSPRVAATWSLPDGISAHDVAVEDGTVWAVSGDPPVLFAMDAGSGRVGRVIPLERPGSWMVDARGPRNTLVIANLEGGAITLVDAATGEQRVMPARPGEIDAAASPDLARIWSVNSRTGELTIFDAVSGSEILRQSSGAGASRVIFTPDGRTALVVHSGENNVTAYDAETGARVGSVAVAPGPKVIAIRADGRVAWITHPAGALTMIDVPSLTVLASLPLHGTPDGVAIAEPGRIEWTDAPAHWPATVRDSVRFGYLHVPVDHTEPDGPAMRMALILVSAGSVDPAPDPIVSIAGGPGLAALDLHMAVRAAGPHPHDIFREKRDLIVIDARGHGYSDPPRCVELDGAEPLAEASAAAERIWLGKLERCRERLTAQGVRLETLSSVQVAHDLEWLRRALGAPQLNLIGLSYGTRIAAEAVRQVPSTVRAVYYSGPVPAGRPVRRSDDSDEVLGTLFDRCAALPACRSEYPNLRADWDSIIARLQSAPMRLSLPPSDALPEGEVVVDAEMIRSGMADLLGTRSLAAGAPLLIHTLAGRGLEPLRHMAVPLMQALRETGVAASTFLAFRCNDGRRATETLPARCRALLGDGWVERADEPIHSDVPGLIITGEFDPRTPPSHARALAAGLPRAYLAIEPWYGHERPSDCTFRVARDFFERPDVAPATACLDSIPPIPFVAGVVPSRWTGNLFTRAWAHPWRVGSAAAMALLLLFASAIALIVREVRGRSRLRPPGERIVSMVLLGVSAVGLTLLVGLAIAMFTGMRQHFVVPLVGLPAAWAWVLALPLLLLATTAVAGLLVIAHRGPGRVELPALLTWTPLAGAVLALALWSLGLR